MLDPAIHVPVVVLAWIALVQPVAADPLWYAGSTARANQAAVVVLGIKTPCHCQLVVAGHARDALGFFLGLGQRRQKQASQNGDDCDHHQQFDKSKSLSELVCHISG